MIIHDQENRGSIRERGNLVGSSRNWQGRAGLLAVQLRAPDSATAIFLVRLGGKFALFRP